MELQKFIEKLPSLYKNWGQNTLTPQSQEFEEILSQINCPTNPNLLQLLNLGVECLTSDEIYCEIGCQNGLNLIGALLHNQDNIAYAVDELNEEQFNQLTDNLTQFNLDEQVFFSNQNFEEFFADLKEIQPDEKIGLYFYNGASDYRSQLLGLLLVRPFLADQALIIVNNSNYSFSQQANYDFLNSQKYCELLLELPVGFGNGITIFTYDITQNSYYSWQEIENKYRNPLAIQKIADFEFNLNLTEKSVDVNELLNQALELNQKGQYDQAIELYKQALIWQKNNPYIYNNIATLYFKQEKYKEALEYAQTSLQIDSSIALHQLNLGKILEKLEEAKMQGDESINVEEEKIKAFLNLGDSLIEQGKYREAIEIYEKALILKPHTPEILMKIAQAYEKDQQLDRALLYYAYVDYRQNKYQDAIKKFEQFFATNQGDEFDYNALGDCYKQNNQPQKARETYLKGLKTYRKNEYLYIHYLVLLDTWGETKEDIEILDFYAKNAPQNLTIQLEVNRFLPHVYTDEEEIKFYRSRFEKFLNYLDAVMESKLLNDHNNLQYALKSLDCKTNFLLQYQGEDDTEFQKKYGTFVNQVMGLKYPQCNQYLSMPPLTEEGKIKIGYVSMVMNGHTVSKLLKGWFKNHNREQFEIYSYYGDVKYDHITNEIKSYSDKFYHISNNIETLAQQIFKDNLHILVFLEIGMHPVMTKLSALRLAPIQCTTWGHPITSGSPNVDYFLSSELMETPDSQKYYTETLINLPNLGICYDKPILPTERKPRSYFNLNDDDLVYLCCQSIFKYLPQYDYILPEIARKVPRSKFVFISRYLVNKTHINVKVDEYNITTQKFYQRLSQAFHKYGLNFDDYCLILPEINTHDYLNLNLVSDVFLDTFGWSGGGTTLEALACNLPIVTCPGKFMRSRHSYGILKMLGVEETITQNEQEYIDIAIKLGLDFEYRNNIKNKIATNLDRIYNDVECVKALENFYQKVVQEKLITQESKVLDFAKYIRQKDFNKKRLLHVGCGPYNPNALPSEFSPDQWLEIRLDIDPNVNPDIIGTITDLSNIPDNSIDGIFSCHNLEHIYHYEVPMALAEFKRVLKMGGYIFIIVPDMQKAAELVLEGNMEDKPLYMSSAGPVNALMMFYGLGTFQPGIPYMAHKTGFTAKSLHSNITKAGFQNVETSRFYYDVIAKGYKL